MDEIRTVDRVPGVPLWVFKEYSTLEDRRGSNVAIRNMSFPVSYLRMMAHFQVITSLKIPGNCLRSKSTYSYYNDLFLFTCEPLFLALTFVVVAVGRFLVKRVGQYTQSIRRRLGLFATIEDVGMRAWAILTFIIYPITAGLRRALGVCDDRHLRRPEGVVFRRE